MLYHGECRFPSSRAFDLRNVSMQNDPVVSKASELCRLELMPTPEEVKAGKVCTMVVLISDRSRANLDVPRICYRLT